MKNKIDNAVEEAKDFKEWAADLTHKFNDQFAKLTAEIKRYSAQGKDMTTETIQEHPLKSVGIAVACGVVIGFLLGRK